MKRTITIISLFTLLLTIPLYTYADRSGPGNPTGEPQTGDPPLGGGAPIGSGLFILLGLGTAYGGKKISNTFSKKKLLTQKN